MRRGARNARRAVGGEARAAAGKAAAQHLAASGLLRAGTRIACYAPLLEEFPTTALLRLALRRGCVIYLPVIANRRLRLLRFAPVLLPPGGSDRTLLAALTRRNRYGIAEPAAPRHLWRSARALDLVMLPLVAFDAHGHRLGMGGGYYDRALANTSGRRPLKLGIAYECQRLPLVPCRAWDVPLDAVLTEKTLHWPVSACLTD
jgi:5-formyltetrahydrofolate cyclo-ligase